MTTFTAAPAPTPVRRAGWARTARIGLWATRIALSAQFVVGGVLKLSADPAMVAMFEDIGARHGLGRSSAPARRPRRSACWCRGWPGSRRSAWSC